MLPQKTHIRSISKKIASLPKHDCLEVEVEGQCAALGERTSTVLQAAPSNGAIMLPPDKLQPNNSRRLPARLRPISPKSDSAKNKIGYVLRQPSNSRTSNRDHGANGVCPSQNLGDLSQSHHQVRKSSRGLDPQSDARASYHGRSLSQQVKPIATSDLLQSKAFPQRQSSTKHARPAFSVMQQHFSPKKAIQLDPLTLSSQSTSKDASPPADLCHLQMELAQLHLLHRSVLPVQVQWEKSAKRSCEHRFGALYERHVELKEIAYQQQTLINQSSLVQWSQGRSGVQISEKVQLLSHNISDICNLLDLGGKYTHILEIFESWFAQALQVRGERGTNGRANAGDLKLIDGIGDGWKAEAMVLERELTYSARDLVSFGEVFQTSDLCRMLSIYRKLVVGLLEELDLIQWIENEIMSRETLWIESTIHKLATHVSENIDSTDPFPKAV